MHRIAIQAGGSHYPQVGGRWHELTVKLTVEEVLDIVQAHSADAGVLTQKILDHFGLVDE
jgi:hypothetical protein